jgi:hypothetical protein
MSRPKKIALFLLMLALAVPIPMQCGHQMYGCATAPDPSGTYYTYYEIEPLGVTLVETFIGMNLQIYYWAGREAHSIGSKEDNMFEV